MSVLGDNVSFGVRSVCSCGARLSVQSTPPDAAMAAMRIFASEHSGIGHVRRPPDRDEEPDPIRVLLVVPENSA